MTETPTSTEENQSEKKKKTNGTTSEKAEILEEQFPFSLTQEQLTEIILGMMDPQNGIKLGMNKGKKKKSKNSFLATEGIDYLRKNKKIPVNEISRKHCVEFCQLMIYLGILENIGDPESKEFLDDESCVMKFNDSVSPENLNEFVENYDDFKKCRIVINDVESMKEFYKKFNHPTTGVQIKDRVQRLVTYKSTFVGADATTWLEIFFGISRQTAVGVGELLRKTGCFMHIGNKGFSDNQSLYRMLSLEEFTSKRPLTPFENISKQMKDIVNQPLAELPVAKDLLRMYKNFKFYREVEDDVFVEDFYSDKDNFEQKSNQEIILKDLFNFLPKFIDPNIMLLEKDQLQEETLQKEDIESSQQDLRKSFPDEEETPTTPISSSFDSKKKDVLKVTSSPKLISPLSQVLERKKSQASGNTSTTTNSSDRLGISSTTPNEKKRSTDSSFFKRKSINAFILSGLNGINFDGSNQDKHMSQTEKAKTLPMPSKRTTSLTLNHLITTEEFKEKVHVSDHQTLTTFISNSFGEYSAPVKILKLAHQGIVVGFLSQLGAELLYNYGMRYKDVKNSWFIKITRHLQKVEKDEYISVAHTRSEEVVVMTEDSTLMTLFKFTWILEMEFDSTKMEEISFIKSSILNFDWNVNGKDSIPSEIKKRHEKKFRYYFDNPKVNKRKSQATPMSKTTSPYGHSEDKESTLDHLFSVSRLISAIKIGSTSDIFKDEKVTDLVGHFLSLDLSQQKKIVELTPKPKHSIENPFPLSDRKIDEITKYLCLSHIEIDYENEKHVHLIKLLFESLTGEQLTDLKGPHWTVVGLRGEDLKLEVQGTGILGLLMIFWVSVHYQPELYQLQILGNKKGFLSLTVLLQLTILCTKGVRAGLVREIFESEDVITGLGITLASLVREFQKIWKSGTYDEKAALQKLEEKFWTKHQKMIRRLKEEHEKEQKYLDKVSLERTKSFNWKK
eukprot:gene7848-12321_t